MNTTNPPRPDENCAASTDGHCNHWYDCEPCCRCGDDTRDPNCDCPRCTPHAHEPSITGLPGSKCKVCGDGFMAWVHAAHYRASRAGAGR